MSINHFADGWGSLKPGGLVSVAVAVFACHSLIAAPPRVTDERYTLELVAREPDIVTPVGMTFDANGRLLVIESHTHQRPAGYDGPERDRVRTFTDSDGDGRLDTWSTFAEGFRHAMNLLARKDGAVYLVERGRVLLLNDTDGDGKADTQQELLRLETKDDYPHNALGGVAQSPDSSLIIGLGENHGEPFRLVGADGQAIHGAGGLDGVFRCAADGKNLEHIARGMWNPFSLCVLQDGRIFAVDNDPDSSPPCRLLHIVEGGDYGYLYQYGRAGTHPLQAWNGELPGTAPMVCGTGEAPTAIVAHADSLWVTSWGDYRIERYRLVPRGSSWAAEREVIVQGDADFRPTGMARAPDGSLYFADWVLRDYPVHGRGRIWRLSLPQEERQAQFPLPTIDQAAIDDPFNRALMSGRLARGIKPQGLVQQWNSGKEAFGPRLGLLAALRMCQFQDVHAVLQSALRDNSAEIRLYAVRWIADERITALRDDVAKLLESPPPSTRYYLAVLAAIDWLDNDPTMRGSQISDELLINELRNRERSPEAHALALRLLSPESKFLPRDRMARYLRSEHPSIRLEAVRTLAEQRHSWCLELLASIAGDESQKDDVRVSAVVGLAADAEGRRPLLEKLAAAGEGPVTAEARRVLRLAKLTPRADEAKPPAANLVAWNKLLDAGGDASSGRQLFFSPIGPRCGVCHQYDGRGGRIGPDLTHIARSNNREQIIAAILQPSRNVAPHYQPWSLQTDDGKTHHGLRLHKAGDNGIEEYVDSSGNEFSLPSESIEERTASDKSIMPDGLEAMLTVDDLRDLVAFLTASNLP